MKLGVLEGLLFVAGEDGLSKEEIMRLLDLDEQGTQDILDKFSNELKADNRGLKLVYLGNTELFDSPLSFVSTLRRTAAPAGTASSSMHHIHRIRFIVIRVQVFYKDTFFLRNGNRRTAICRPSSRPCGTDRPAVPCRSSGCRPGCSPRRSARPRDRPPPASGR